MASLREKAIALVSTTNITDLSSVAATTLYVVPAGKIFIPTEAWMEVEGDVGANLAFTMGRSTALTDFIGTTNGDNLDAAGDCIVIKPVPSATPPTNKRYAAAVIFQINVTVGGNAVAGKVHLFGILRDA